MTSRKLSPNERKILRKIARSRPESFPSMLVGGMAIGGLATLGIFFVIFLIYLVVLFLGLIRRDDVPQYIPVSIGVSVTVWITIGFFYAFRQWRQEAQSRAAFYLSPNLAEEDLKADIMLIEKHAVTAAKEVDYEEHCWDGGWFIRTETGQTLFVPRESPELKPTRCLKVEHSKNQLISNIEWSGSELVPEEKLPPLIHSERLTPLVPLSSEWNNLRMEYCIKNDERA